jgi:hypothetical protein
MKWRLALVATVLVTLGGAFALAGCGGDDCTRATDHFAECSSTVTTTSSSGSGGMPQMQVCSGVLLCQSQCINQHTCAEITGQDPIYSACLAACQGK